MGKEKIIVARNCEPEGSPSEYLGAEVSIGLLTVEKITELKLLLQNEKFQFNGMTYLRRSVEKSEEIIEESICIKWI